MNTDCWRLTAVACPPPALIHSPKKSLNALLNVGPLGKLENFVFNMYSTFAGSLVTTADHLSFEPLNTKVFCL